MSPASIASAAVASSPNRAPALADVTVFANPKSRILACPALGHENIRGLDVAMHDALAHAPHPAHPQSRSPRSSSHPAAAPSPAIRCFRVCPSRNSMTMNGSPVVFADLMNRADIRMVQRRSRLRLAPKSSPAPAISRHILRQKLQSHEAMQRGVLSLVHHAHAAAAKFLENSIMRDSLANHGCDAVLGDECYVGLRTKSTNLVASASPPASDDRKRSLDPQSARPAAYNSRS